MGSRSLLWLIQEAPILRNRNPLHAEICLYSSNDFSSSKDNIILMERRKRMVLFREARCHGKVDSKMLTVTELLFI